MATVEPVGIDPERWPGLLPPDGDGGAAATVVARALRGSARSLDLRIDYPDASAAGDYDASARLVLERPAPFWARLAESGVVGFAESFMAGEWTTPDLPSLLRVLVPWVAGNPDCRRPGRRSRAGRRPGARRRSDAERLEDDLPGDLVALYTDETMSTTAAVFASGARTRSVLPDGTEVVHLEAPAAPPHRTDLGDAQRRAADMLLDLAAVGPGSHVVVAPPGWGEIPMRAAERGAWVRTVTSSTERLAVLGGRIGAGGLGSSIALSLDPVSRVTGRFDAVVAAEPAAQTGLEGVGAVVDAAGRLLHPGGRLVLQTSVTAGGDGVADLAEWRRSHVSDETPTATMSDLADLVSERSRLRYRGRVELTTHHAETVRLWRESFAVRGRDAAALGFDAVFRRMWAFHLAALETSLRERWVETVQAVYDLPR